MDVQLVSYVEIVKIFTTNGFAELFIPNIAYGID